ncbi:MAG: hypothetical protein PWQ16_1394, partial [bacterium]|nr:hypothetical protein [bacterium]
MTKAVRIAGVLLYLAMMVLGVFYPLIGVAVLGYLITMVVLGKRKRWCAINCPRGSFYDIIVSKLSFMRPLPKLLKSSITWKILLALFVALMSFQIYMVSHFDGCFKLLQSVLPTYPHTKESRKDKTLSFS